MSEDGELIIEASSSRETLVRDLQPLCDAGYVCDFTLRDGTNASAVLVGVSSTRLIVDHWDRVRHRPAGDQYVIELEAISRVVVP